jgi:MFS transporter, MHS family, proline/betaine transporter
MADAKTNKKQQRKNLRVAVVANVLEWYDFGLYGYFAPIIGQLFFPSEDKLASLIATFAVFALGYVARPLGGVVFGHYGDRVSRHRALIVSIVLMAAATTLLGLLPTYAQVGIWSAILLTAVRVVQGFSVGGQLGTSLSILVENADSHRRGLVGSWTNAGAILGMLLASGVGALITRLAGPEWINDWGWRIPFLIGACLGIVGLLMKGRPEDSDSTYNNRTSDNEHAYPVKQALAGHWKDMLTGLGCLWISALSFYTIFVFMTTYLSTETPIPLYQALELNTVGMAVFMFLVIYMGSLSDRRGRKPLLIWGSVAIALMTYPLFMILMYGHPVWDLGAQVTFAVAIAAIQGTLPTALAELFPGRIRCSAVALTYNVGFAVFGGTAPLLCTFLIRVTGDKLAPGYYLIAVALISLLLMLRLKESAHKPLR